ncbi:MAG: UDP-N-acetylglucosamine 1-carboxyvinyltransferase [Nitrospirae bacterium]|nr:UDP-N-acetylglucosamine 1-carboxyvinyltransferase [Nitrospirota bacterium]
MDKIAVKGGKKLKGSVSISGAKNSALPVMTASILSAGESRISNLPALRDISTMGRLLENLGIGFSFKKGKASLNAEKIIKAEAPYDLVKTMRASVLVLGPLLARTGKAKVSLPGGCAIGARPINLHVKGLEKMGAKISLSDGYINAKARRLKGAVIYFDIPTVTGTENLMMAASLAEGETLLENAACEPEVVDLADALISMGASIEGAGTSIIKIKGVRSLSPLDYKIIPDRIETGTFIAAAGITGGDIEIKSCNPDHMVSVIVKLRETGMEISHEKNILRVKGPEKLRAVDVRTMPYPGFPTDMQAQFMALMAVADGTSMITENIFENRFMHVAEMRRMGAKIKIENATATVEGVEKLKGAPVMATDLRASASLLVAALAAEGETIIDRVYHIDRGYEKIEEKLMRLGADVRRVT